MLAVMSLMIWLYLVTLHGKFWQPGSELAPVRPERAPQQRTPQVAIVVPARDEADFVARSVGSLLAQDYPGAFRVLLVDDGSADGTAEIARGLRGPLAVIAGKPRPAGWAGKLWAVSQGVAATDEEYVLLTDADITHDPGHLSALVAHAERTGVDMVSEMVRLNCVSLAERMLVPAFVYLFALLYPFAWVNDPLRATAAAAGGTVLIRRRALERIGGIAAIRGALIDDVALAVRMKMGGRIWLGHSGLARSIRPYPGFADIWQMVARSAYVQLKFSPLRLGGTVAVMALVFFVPAVTALSGSWVGMAAWLVMAGSFVPILRRYRVSPAWAMALPGIAGFYMAATLGSAWKHYLGRGVEWKRRAYGPS